MVQMFLIFTVYFLDKFKFSLFEQTYYKLYNWIGKLLLFLLCIVNFLFRQRITIALEKQY